MAKNMYKTELKSIFRLYEKSYKMLNNVTPLHFDCGQLCNNRCCTGENLGMYLFPFEYEYMNEMLNMNPNTTMTKDNIYLYTCDGTCERNFRPLACRIFPFFPCINKKDELEVVFDSRAHNICPLRFTDIKEIKVRNDFKRKIYKSFKKLIKVPQIYEFVKLMSDEIIFLDEFRAL